MKDKIIQIAIDKDGVYLGLGESGTTYRYNGDKWVLMVLSPFIQE